MRTITKKCLLLFTMLLLLTVAVGCGASNDPDDADSAKSKKKTETEGKADPSEDEEDSAIKTILGGQKSAAYLTMELNGNEINFAQDHDKVCEDLAKNNFLVFYDAIGCFITWDEESGTTQSQSLMDYMRNNVPTDGLLMTHQSFVNFSTYDEATQNQIILSRPSQEYAFVSTWDPEYCDSHNSKDLSFKTPDGITEKSTWEDVLKIKGGLESSGSIFMTLQNFSPIGDLFPNPYLSPERLFMASSDFICPDDSAVRVALAAANLDSYLTSYMVIYEDGIAVELNTSQFEEDFDRYYNDGKSVQDYYDLYLEASAADTHNGKTELRSNTALKDFWDEATDLTKIPVHVDKSQLFQAMALNISTQKFMNGEIKELAVVTYVTYNGMSVPGTHMDKDAIGVDIIYMCSPE